MAADSQSPEAPAVALLFEDAEQSAYLRDALKALGARIVHEGAATAIEQQALLDAGADVVVVNLDDEVEAHLDRVYDALDESRHRVIFNDAAASRGLSGWDHARWARHLAAKLMGALDVDPPRPADARAVEPRAEPVHVEPVQASRASDVMTPVDDGATVAADVDPEPAGSEADPALADSLTEELQALLAEGDGLLSEAGVGETAASEGGITPVPLADSLPEPDADLSEPPTIEAGGEAEMFARFEDAVAASGDEAELVDADALFASALPAGSTDAVGDTATGTEAPKPETGADTQSDEMAAAADTVPGAIRFGELSLADDPALADIGAGAEPADAAADASMDVPDWGLVDFDVEPVADAVQTDADERADPSDFGIEKVSAAEFLTPADEGNDAEIEPGLTLELVSIEEAMAPSLSDAPAHEMMLDEATGLPRLVVVAADAAEMAPVERFLAALPAGLPMAVLVLPHATEPVDLDAMREHLDAVSALRVRHWTQGLTLRAGDVAIAPPDEAVRVGRDGTARSVADGEPLSLCTKSFGPDLLAMVCGGPARELGEALQAVRDGGGHVWAHVDDAEPPHEAVEHGQQRGLVEQAEPAEALAARLSAEFGLTP